jgi:non-ribosomal peptide synthetase component E (peptide arylation enzyme)
MDGASLHELIVDDEGVELPRDGESSGRILVRGPWVIDRYYQCRPGACSSGCGCRENDGT